VGLSSGELNKSLRRLKVWTLRLPSTIFDWTLPSSIHFRIFDFFHPETLEAVVSREVLKVIGQVEGLPQTDVGLAPGGSGEVV